MNTRKRKYTTTILATALLFSLGGCVKDELHDTPHPDTGKVTVTVDWSDRGEGVDITLAVYNPADDIMVSGTTAAVVQEAGNGAYISNTPGWLFTSVQEVAIEADTDYSLTAVMRQQVRQLTLMIEPTGDAAERIESIVGTLSGAAGTLDFATGTYGTPSEVELHFTKITDGDDAGKWTATFTKITDGDDAGKWTATVRLLGIAGNLQRLTATLTYTDGNPQPTALESDLTTALDGFNDGKTAPLTLGGTIAETPGEAGFTGEITDWETVDGGGVDAEM